MSVSQSAVKPRYHNYLIHLYQEREIVFPLADNSQRSIHHYIINQHIKTVCDTTTTVTFFQYQWLTNNQQKQLTQFIPNNTNKCGSGCNLLNGNIHPYSLPPAYSLTQCSWPVPFSLPLRLPLGMITCKNKGNGVRQNNVSVITT